MNKKTVGTAKIREDHKSEVLNYIRRFGPVSRTDIYEKTQISKPTVTRIIENLLENNIVTETGIVKTSSGRKPINIELNPQAYYCIGLNISRNTIYASVIDLAMNVVYCHTADIRNTKNEKAFQQTVEQAIRYLLDNSGVCKDKFLGIGVGAPGKVNYHNGIIMDFALLHNLRDIPLKQHLEDAFGLKVYIDNNANTRALGEYWYGYGTGYRNIIFIICSEGIGSGIISDGSILRGKSNTAGEIGHMTVRLDGRKCVCEGYGCLEAYCTTEALEEMTREVLRRGRHSELLDEVKGNIEAIDYKLICKYAGKDDKVCMERLEEAACYLSTGLSNLVGVVDPEIIILSGTLLDESDFFYTKVVEMTRQKLTDPKAQDLVFKKRSVKDSLYEIGAATMVFKTFFKD